MGILNNIVGALKDTNEAAHGSRLKKDVFATLDLLHRAGPEVETEGLMLFMQLQEQILSECKSWSREGHLKIANQLQADARKRKDFEIGRACGYYLASAFAECMVRDSPEAKLTLVHLGVVAAELEKQIAAQSQKSRIKKSTPDIFGMADLCMTSVLTAAFWPPNGERSTDDFMPRLEELTLDGKVIVVGVAFGIIDGIGQRIGATDAETLACAAAFLSSKLYYEEAAIATIVKDMMAHSSRPGSNKYDYISLGGRAASAICADPNDLGPLSDCGFKVREWLDAIVLW